MNDINCLTSYFKKTDKLKIILDFDKCNKYIINFSNIFIKTKKEIFNNVEFKFKYENKFCSLDIKEIIACSSFICYLSIDDIGINNILHRPINHVLFLDIENIKDLIFKDNIKLSTDAVLCNEINDFLFTWKNVNFKVQ